MSRRLVLVVILLSILFIIPSGLLSLASTVIGIKNTNTTCDDNGHDIIRLSTWLFVNAAIETASIILYVTLMLLFFKKEQYKFLIITIVTYILNCIFAIVWNILGGIELFKNATDCQFQASSLWTMVLISLIFQWVNLGLVFCVVRFDCSNIIRQEETNNMNNSEDISINVNDEDNEAESLIVN